jgi:hypothetical protein
MRNGRSERAAHGRCLPKVIAQREDAPVKRRVHSAETENLNVKQSANVTHAGDLVCVPDDGDLGREMSAVRGALGKSGRRANVMTKRSSDYPM